MKPQKGEMYVHYKKPDQKYRIVGIALDTETDEDVVVYEPMYENKYSLFTRPLKVWNQEVEFEGKKMKRFQLTK